jgi:murein DD-endopeptidase MepM/ murein hydrolase activator NlpD
MGFLSLIIPLIFNNGLWYNQPMWTFPLPQYAANLPGKGHPGAFGTLRRHDIHTGVDLYCPVNTPALAVEAGTVVLINLFTGPRADSPWWQETSFVAVQGHSGVVLYGEILPTVTLGQKISAGDQIGLVQQVLTKDKGKPMSMLHLELYNQIMDPVIWLLNQPQPQGLLDPTDYLLSALAK